MESAAPDPDAYREQWEELCLQLAGCAERTDVLGTDLAQFAWAEARVATACANTAWLAP